MSSKPPLPPQPPRFGALGSRASTGASAATAACSSRRRAATDLGNPAAIEMAKARTMQAAQERPVGLLETDLDEAVVPSTTTPPNAATTGKKTRSLLNLNHTSTAPRPRPEHALHVPQSPVAASHRSPRDKDAASTINQRPHKSMEFLLDKENLHFVKVSALSPSFNSLTANRSSFFLFLPPSLFLSLFLEIRSFRFDSIFFSFSFSSDRCERSSIVTSPSRHTEIVCTASVYLRSKVLVLLAFFLSLSRSPLKLRKPGTWIIKRSFHGYFNISREAC